MKRSLLFLFLLVCTPMLLSAGTQIKGKITTSGNTAPKLAHVHLYPVGKGIGTEPTRTIQVNNDGTYALELPDPGYYQLVVTGVDHNMVSTPLYVTGKEKPITLDITLPAFEFDHNPETVYIIGDWNNFDFNRADAMEKQKNGTFTYTFKTDKKETHYQLIGIASTSQGMRSINAPLSNNYVYDGGGDYRSVTRVTPGEVTITFDPADLPASTGSTEPVVQSSNPVLMKLWEIEYLFNNTNDQFMQAATAAQQTGETVKFAEMWRPFGDLMTDFLSEEHSTPVRQFAALTYARMLRYSRDPQAVFPQKETRDLIKELLPPESLLWEANPALATIVASFDEADPNAAIMEVVRKNPDHTVQGIALSQVAMSEYFNGNTDEAMKHYATLKDTYGDVEEIGYVLAQLNPDKRIQQGKAIPAFDVQLLGEENHVSNTSMKGKFYLLDFWAVWCGPCRAEMPELHTAYEEFGGDNFEILSISFDAAPDDVEEYRAKKWTMPWLHTFAEGNFQSNLAQTFEVTGIPKPILVDPNGTIVAVGEELRGKKLTQTLARLLGDGQATR